MLACILSSTQKSFSRITKRYISEIAVNYYKESFGYEGALEDFTDDIEFPTIIEVQRNTIATSFLALDVFKMLKIMAKDKFPVMDGPVTDGFSVEFYLKIWDIVGKDVINNQISARKILGSKTRIDKGVIS